MRSHRLAIACVVLLCIWGCGHVEIDPVPPAPASALPSGFVVGADSRLVGTTFGDDHTWTALLDIERDPVGVFDAYLAQAKRLGVTMPTSGSSVFFGERGCRPGEGKQLELPLWKRCYRAGPTCYVEPGVLPGRPDVFRCAAFDLGPNRQPLRIDMRLAWGGSTRRLQLDVGPGTTARPEFQWATDEGPWHGTLPLSREPAREDTADRPFGSKNNASYRGYRRLTVEPGSRVVSDAPEMNQEVIEITGEPTEVLQRYARQLAEGVGEPDDEPAEVTTERTPDGEEYLTLVYGPSGGGGASFVTDSTRRFVLLSYSSD